MAEGIQRNSSIKLIYILYLVGIVFGVTALVGLIMAYVNKSENEPVALSHYRFQIRTFWIGLMLLLISVLTSVVFIGYLILLFWVVWAIIRVAKGMRYLEQGIAHPAPATWFFG